MGRASEFLVLVAWRSDQAQDVSPGPALRSFTLSGSARTDVPSLCPEGLDVMVSDEQLVVSQFAS